MGKNRLGPRDMEQFRKNLFPSGDPLQRLITPPPIAPEEPLILYDAPPEDPDDPGAPAAAPPSQHGLFRLHQSATLLEELLTEQLGAAPPPDPLSPQVQTTVRACQTQLRRLRAGLLPRARIHGEGAVDPGPATAERRAFLAALQRRLIYLGCTAPPEVFCVLGTSRRDGAPVALCRQGGQVLLLCGAPGYGKSQLALCLVESHLAPCPSLTSAAHQATAAAAFVTDDSAQALPELLAALLHNQVPADAERLWQEFRARPQPIRRVNVVVPAWQLSEWRDKLQPHLRAHAGLRLLPLYVGLHELGLAGLESVLSADREAAYFQRLLEEAAELGRGIQLSRWQATIEGAKDLHAGQRAAALRALRLLTRIAPPGDQSLWDAVEPGALTLFVLGGQGVGRAEVLPLCAGLIEALSQESPRHGPFQRLYLLDEINRLDGERRVWDSLVTLARRIRHRGGVLVVLGQDFLHLPEEVLALATLGGVFHIDSPEVLAHLRAHFGGLRKLTMEEARALEVGEVVLAPRQCTDREWLTRGYQVVRLRPPLAQHGGHGRRAL